MSEEIIFVSQTQRDNLLEAMNVMWPSVPEKNVVRNLDLWRMEVAAVNPAPLYSVPTCTTIACFGGWCAWWPTFVAQGVRCSHSGMPLIVDLNTCFTSYDREVASVLFGFEALFFYRGSNMAERYFGSEDDDASAHEVVNRRMQWLLDHSTVTK